MIVDKMVCQEQVLQDIKARNNYLMLTMLLEVVVLAQILNLSNSHCNPTMVHNKPNQIPSDKWMEAETVSG
jgi:hypothetical protein